MTSIGSVTVFVGSWKRLKEKAPASSTIPTATGTDASEP
jgi:hypothetical protein